MAGAAWSLSDLLSSLCLLPGEGVGEAVAVVPVSMIVPLLGAADDRGALAGLADHPAFVAARALELQPVQARALAAVLVHDAAKVAEADVPVRYGVVDGRLWIARAPGARPEARSRGVPASPLQRSWRGSSVRTTTRSSLKEARLASSQRRTAFLATSPGNIR